MKKSEKEIINATKVKCIAEGIYSKKLFGGYVTPAGTFVRIPANVMRAGRPNKQGDPNYIYSSTGWKVIVTIDEKKIHKYFADAHYGGERKSLKAAVEYLKEFNEIPMLGSGNRVYTKEKQSKKTKLDQVGIILSQYKCSRTGQPVFRFTVSVKGGKKHVYIGKEQALYTNKFNTSLNRAIEIRDKKTQDFNQENKFQ